MGNGIKRFATASKMIYNNYLVKTYVRHILEYVTPDKEDQFTNIILGFGRFEIMWAIAQICARLAR